jgi:5-methylcytosine-specific restriction endonuclease McrA
MATQTWTRLYNDYLLSPEWKSKREKVLVFWGHRCALCNSPIRVEVHHRTYDRMGQELMTDLIPLCDKCHERHSIFMRRGVEHISGVLQRVVESIENG